MCWSITFWNMSAKSSAREPNHPPPRTAAGSSRIGAAVRLIATAGLLTLALTCLGAGTVAVEKTTPPFLRLRVLAEVKIGYSTQDDLAKAWVKAK